jgi:hypothetical protein
MDIYFSSYPVLRLRALGWGFPGLLGGLSRFGVLGLLGTAPGGLPDFIESIRRIKKFWNYRFDTSTAKAIFDGMPW